MNLSELASLLGCAQCEKGMVLRSDFVSCESCEKRYAIENDIIITSPTIEARNENPIQRWMENSAVAKIYTSLWRPFWFFFMKGDFSFEDEAAFYQRHINNNQDGLIVDLCCGPGYFTNYLQVQSKLIGIDLSVPMLNSAKEQRNSGSRDLVDFIQGSVYNLPLGNETSSAVLLAGALHLLENLDGIFSEVSRILKKDGVLTGSVYSLSSQPMIRAAQQVGSAGSGLIAHDFMKIRALAERHDMILIDKEQSLFTTFFTFRKQTQS